jgi:hypothetical protein
MSPHADIKRIASGYDHTAGQYLLKHGNITCFRAFNACRSGLALFDLNFVPKYFFGIADSR